MGDGADLCWWGWRWGERLLGKEKRWEEEREERGEGSVRVVKLGIQKWGVKGVCA